MLKIGVIADDFTGATDIASFLVENGMPTVQINDVPTGTQPEGCDAVVISLKTRSCPAQEAIKQSLAALVWLKKQGCQQVYFKYCSTFDSTAEGNIGPVTDALMVALDTLFTVISPALPVNGRTVYQGYLFVMNHLLAESGMRHHPINPMTDSYLPRLMEAQAQGRCGVIPAQTLDEGVAATRAALSRLQQEGYRYAVLDALNERHLEIQGEVLRDALLVTGGSGRVPPAPRHSRRFRDGNGAGASVGEARRFSGPFRRLSAERSRGGAFRFLFANDESAGGLLSTTCSHTRR